MASRNNKSGCGHALSPPLPKRLKKSQADKPAWPVGLKLSAGGQLDGYFEYVELVVVAGASFF
jgi:hypothetical protein